MTRDRIDRGTEGSGSAKKSKKPKRTTEKKPAAQKKAIRAQSSREEVPHDPRWQQARWRSLVRKNLLRWFEANARELPWRSDPTPYHVWISEIMLQQTQVATVLPYWHRFMESFPTVAHLAAADETELMRHWEGLGYYRRARSLHAAAKQIVEQHEGSFPRTFDEVIALPGIGRYTAGAILSISDGQRLPVLEGNTQRVYSRWVSMQTPPTDKAANALLWNIGENMLPAANASTHSGIFNQAAMELGALVCTPKNPSCDQCPVRNQCAANADGLQDVIPGKISRTRYEERTEFALVVSRPHADVANDRESRTAEFLVRPLPEGGRWAGLWDFPRSTEQELESVVSAASVLSEDIGLSIQPGIRLKTIKHAVTKYRITLHIHDAALNRGRKRVRSPWAWKTLDQIDQLPMSVTGRKIAKILTDSHQQLLPLN